MHPILVKIGSLTVYSYGVMVAIGFTLAAMLIYRRAVKFNIDQDKCVDLTIAILIFGILGARGLYVLLNLAYYAANPIEIVMLSKGGLVWYGGFLFALIAMVVYLRINKLSFWPVVDLLTPYIALAQGFGRIGCFLNGCCYGIKVAPGFPFAATFPCEAGVPRIPSQLISAALLFIIFVVLVLWQNARRFEGEIALGYCVLYSVKRFAVEFLRGDNPKILLGLTMSQVISVAIFAVSLTIFILRARHCKARPTILK